MLPGLSKSYYLSLNGFTGPGGQPEQHSGLESRGNGRYHCLDIICKRSFLVQCSQVSLEQTGYPNKSYTYSALCLCNWLSLRKPVKINNICNEVIFFLMFISLVIKIDMTPPSPPPHS